jgi:hypothetical protein
MKATSRNALLACVLFAPFAQGAPGGGEAPIEEVIINATKPNIVKLAQQVRMAEFRFYQRYNELNTKRDYAVNCRIEGVTGSRFASDVCVPVFQDKARAAEGRAFAEVIQGSHLTPDGSIAVVSTPKPPASMAIAAGRPGFQQNMIEITRKNADLIKLLNEYGALVKQYEDAYRRTNGAKSSTKEKAATPATPAASPAASGP